MKRLRMVVSAALAACFALAIAGAQQPQQRVHPNSNTERGGADVKQVPGKKIGGIKTVGDIIHLELDENVVQQNLFDLDKRTIRFTPATGGFRAENLPLQWDEAAGTQLQGNAVRLTKFQFPFSGKTWDAMTVTATGLIGFGGGYNDLRLGRFVHLQHVGPDIVNTIPVIAAFLKQRMNGTRFVNELVDRVVITWNTSESTSGQQDVTFVRTPHNYQAVLYKDGRVDLSYREMTARDGVVGIYTIPAGGPLGMQKPVDFTNLQPRRAPQAVIFEAFHHYSLPGASNMACTVIQALGDRFDFMVWYSDFRVDDQEAGTRSVGDIGQKVSGLGPRMDGGLRLQDYCSKERLQVTWYQPVWIGAVQAQAQHPDGRYAGYNMAVAQIGHELAHRWSTRTRVVVNGETIELRAPHDPWGMSGATHWPGSVTTPVPFPYSRPVEASIMGGTHWKDNGDGTFTQLANGTMNPASGFSYLELYLMGFLPASKVPDFFMLRNQQNVGRTPEGQNIVKADKVTITIQDVIAHNGPRVPSFEDSPKALTTALVAVTLKGRQPAPAMLTQLEGIASAWKGYWSKVTGGVSTMSTSPGSPPTTPSAVPPATQGAGQVPGPGSGLTPVVIGPPAPVPPEVAIPRPTPSELAQVNDAVRKFIDADQSPVKPLLKQFESLLLLQPARLNVAATYTQTRQRQGSRHLGFVEIARQGNIDLLLHGDSITDWWVQGDANTAMFEKYFSEIRTANFAVSGDTTQGVLWGLRNGEGQGFQPKAVMVMIGTNNSAQSSAPEIAEGIGAVVLELRRNFPEAKILLLAIFPRSVPGDPVRDKIADVNRIIARLDDRQYIHYMDIGSAFLDEKGYFLPGAFRADNLHPQALGYDLWGTAVRAKLAELLK